MGWPTNRAKKLQRSSNFYQGECESAKAHIAVGGGDNEHHIWWVCKENKVKGYFSSSGGQNGELKNGQERSGFAVVGS